MAWLSRRRTSWLKGIGTASLSFSKYGYVRLPVIRENENDGRDSPPPKPKNGIKKVREVFLKIFLVVVM
jgi:hypothetical protein